MSRSEYVYLVMKGPDPVAAFTVKYEMENWIMSYPGQYSLFRIRYGTEITRLPSSAAKQEGQD